MGAGMVSSSEPRRRRDLVRETILEDGACSPSSLSESDESESESSVDEADDDDDDSVVRDDVVVSRTMRA